MNDFWDLGIVAFNLDMSCQKWQAICPYSPPATQSRKQATESQERKVRQRHPALIHSMGNCAASSARQPALEMNVLGFALSLILLPGNCSWVSWGFIVCFPLLFPWGSGFAPWDSLSFLPMLMMLIQSPQDSPTGRHSGRNLAEKKDLRKVLFWVMWYLCRELSLLDCPLTSGQVPHTCSLTCLLLTHT
jgi:hypothetical protein